MSRILDDAEGYLRREWDLCIKPSSRAILAPVHSADVSTSDESKWPVVLRMKVLGHWLQNDGATNFCFEESLQSIWRAFFANCAGAEVSRLSMRVRTTLLLRTVTPILRFKWTRWPFTTSKAIQLDAVQRRMIGILLCLRRQRDDPLDVYIRRRGRRAGELQRATGAWSKGWAQAVVNWGEHLKRPRNGATWAAMLAELRSPDELAERRAVNGGRPRTRSCGGFVRKRWWESVGDAQLWTQQH